MKSHFEMLKNLENEIYVHDLQTEALLLENKRLKEVSSKALQFAQRLWLIAEICNSHERKGKNSSYKFFKWSLKYIQKIICAQIVSVQLNEHTWVTSTQFRKPSILVSRYFLRPFPSLTSPQGQHYTDFQHHRWVLPVFEHYIYEIIRTLAQHYVCKVHPSCWVQV